MKSSSRRSLFWGLFLGVLLSLLVVGLLHLWGYHFMHMAKAPSPAVTPGEAKPKLWHCPMHPQIIRDAPGKCPICGMDLVPVRQDAAAAPSPAAPAPAKEEKKPLCYVSPKNPDFVKFEPGKDPEGNELVPVYPAKPGAPVPEGKKVKLWVSPMDPKFVRDKPGKDPMGHDLVPLEGMAGAPEAPAAAEKKEKKIKYWVSPMDPGYVSDKPGKAPCGMDLVPVYETEAETAAEGTIAVEPNTLQSMGVRTAKAELRPLSRTIRAVGIVNYDERRLAIVNTKIKGWVDRLYTKVTGEPIRKGQPLISIYSPELVSGQREYLLALKNLKALEKSPYPEIKESAQRLLEASRRRLEYWDIPRGQIETLQKTGVVKKDLTLNSPVNGIVIKRMVTQGQMVEAGMPLLEVADLSEVWIDGDIYEYELPWVKVGQPAEVTLAYIPGETFHGKVQYIYPYLKGATRTARVRLSFPNPGLKLKPEMYGQVLIKAPLPQSVVAVPTEAILDSGEKQVVFIALGKGRFEPREVKVGVEGDGSWREVVSGLKGGEEIVTSAQFLLDSESRIREAIAKMLRTPGHEAHGGAPAPGAPAAPAPPEKKEAPGAAPAAPGVHKH
ncbi:MAG: efflux RND transporter periplasmic adaptor subunit [Deltaproteobacteria bacterium]|nr:MAG: efflux RND transporter periplasmic adaptor subunit [Deltaproteobacteria bacterium]